MGFMSSFFCSVGQIGHLKRILPLAVILSKECLEEVIHIIGVISVIKVIGLSQYLFIK